jgi:aspartyl-tRNA(Asn)/glutamyl-tRNA(Gln) amidotransferase subunit C
MAGLARLSLGSDEIGELTADLDNILDYVEVLRGVDTRAVEPTAHALPFSTPLRDDCAEVGLDPQAALQNAPAASGDTFVVPKVIEGGEA